MKITGPGNIRDTQAGKRRRADASDVGGAFSSLLTSQEAGGSEGTAEAGAFSPVSSLMGLQEVSQEESKKKKALRHGDKMLDELDNLRLSLIAGIVPRQQLLEIRRATREQQSLVDDPVLQDILNEIETRAEVELAKLENISY